MPHYKFAPSYLFDPDFTLYTDHLINTRLDFIEDQARLRLLHRIHNPENTFFCRNLNCDEYEFVVASYIYDKKKMKNGALVYSTVSSNDSPAILHSIQRKTPFFTNMSLKETPRYGITPVFVDKGIYYHTFECRAHDVLDDKEMLNQQILWTFNNNESVQSSVMDLLYKQLSKYQDFYGLYCTYDGNKKVQIHTEWDIRGIVVKHFSINDDYTANEYELSKELLMICWKLIEADVKAVIAEYGGIEVKFNQELLKPETNRRLPWGIRRVSNKNEIFPIGSEIPQVSLYANNKHTLLNHLMAKNVMHEPRKRII